jgi:hypothetical protein
MQFEKAQHTVSVHATRIFGPLSRSLVKSSARRSDRCASWLGQTQTKNLKPLERMTP